MMPLKKPFASIGLTAQPSHLTKIIKFKRFTPRNSKSTYSQANKERLKWLLENKMIHPKFEEKTRSILSEPFISQ